MAEFRSPSLNELQRMMDLLKYVIFPEFSDIPSYTDGKAALKAVLRSQLQSVGIDSDEVQNAFMEGVSEVARLLNTDVEAVTQNDPAVTDKGEVILCYPVVKVMLHYRAAHLLYTLGVPRIPRMLTEMAHSATGIDIHPAAKIGEYFAIDHGTGVVIGATSIIGNHVMLYQGVTLGAKNFKYDDKGHPIDLPRHPILEDNVTVYSNASILGRVTIGHDTIIGGNVWLTHDVPPGSKVLQSGVVEQPLFQDGGGI